MRIMTEAEWRGLGVKQSLGWVHYMLHSRFWTITAIFATIRSPVLILLPSLRFRRCRYYGLDPEPHILIFRRDKPTQPASKPIQNQNTITA